MLFATVKHPPPPHTHRHWLTKHLGTQTNTTQHQTLKQHRVSVIATTCKEASCWGWRVNHWTIARPLEFTNNKIFWSICLLQLVHNCIPVEEDQQIEMSWILDCLKKLTPVAARAINSLNYSYTTMYLYQIRCAVHKVKQSPIDHDVYTEVH